MTFQWNDIATAPREGAGVKLLGREIGPYIMLAQKDGHVCIGFWNGRSWDDGDWKNDMGDFDYWAPLPEVPVDG